MGRYLSRMFFIILAGVAAELFLPSVTGGTSFGGRETQNPGLCNWVLHRQIEAVLPVYGMLEAGEIAGEPAEREDPRQPGKPQAQPLEENLRLLSLEEMEGNTGGEAAGGGTDMAADANVHAQDDQTDMEATDMEAASANAAVSRQMPDFVPGEQQQTLELERYRSYEELVKEFYTIDANTMAGNDQLNIEKLMQRDLEITESGEGPLVLIYHTHSQEAYADSVPGDPATSVVGVGEYLARILQEEYGYRVMHCAEEFDVEDRNQAYSKALPALEQILKENPSIQVMIDLHRDEMPANVRLVTELDGKPTARFMFFNGLSRTRKTGDIAYLKNENIAGNLAFSFQMQLKCAEYYPGLTRKIYLKGYRYNLHLRERSLLVELGAQNNTVEEAMNACGPLAHALHLVLSGEKEGFAIE